MNLLYALLAFSQLHQVPNYERGNSPLPYRARWGTYNLVVEQIGKDEDGSPQHVVIRDRRGRTQREIRAWGVTGVNLTRLTGHSPAELHIALWTGGAYCCYTDVYFTLQGGLHNILIFDGGELGIRGIKDLNHDGVPEIITENPVLGDYSAYNFHRHWPLITILGWDGKQYVDVTRRYPQRSLREAAQRKRDVLDAQRVPVGERREWDLQDKITAYYANMMNVGREREAKRWLVAHLNVSEKRWLRQNESELRRIVATSAQRRAYVSQTKVIEQLLRVRREADDE